MVMGQFNEVLRDALLATMRLGLPLAILFLIGYLLYLRSERKNSDQ